MGNRRQWFFDRIKKTIKVDLNGREPLITIQSASHADLLYNNEIKCRKRKYYDISDKVE